MDESCTIPLNAAGSVLLKVNGMADVKKINLLAAAAIPVIIALAALMYFPTIAASTQADYSYALNPQSWAGIGEPEQGSEMALTTEFTATINARGFAFQRVDNETIKQGNCTTHLVVVVTPATEASDRAVDVTGTVTIGDAVYTITDGMAFLGREKKVLYLNCTGMDDANNEITLKFGGHYFWWGGKAYALRTWALLQTDDGPMLLLQRGIARIS
jgi:hypothetical protein